jgi:hypothetical protein
LPLILRGRGMSGGVGAASAVLSDRIDFR